jgi:hypothetical protein
MVDNKSRLTSDNAFLIIAVQNEQLMFKANFPLCWVRWILILVSTVAAAAGAPSIVRIANQLLNIG